MKNAQSLIALKVKTSHFKIIWDDMFNSYESRSWKSSQNVDGLLWIRMKSIEALDTNEELFLLIHCSVRGIL